VYYYKNTHIASIKIMWYRFFIRGKSFFGVCPVHFYDICIKHELFSACTNGKESVFFMISVLNFHFSEIECSGTKSLVPALFPYAYAHKLLFSNNALINFRRPIRSHLLYLSMFTVFHKFSENSSSVPNWHQKALPSKNIAFCYHILCYLVLDIQNI